MPTAFKSYCIRGCSELQSKLYACQVILAFEYLQYLDIMHRDLKPENLLIDPSGNVKVCPFELCSLKYTQARKNFSSICNSQIL